MVARALACVLVAPALFAADPAYQSIRAKLDRLEDRNVKRGEVIVFTAAEIDSWAHVTVPEFVPEGIRNERVELGTDTASAYALVDFLKMRQGKGQATGWLIGKLIEGERPLKVSIRLASGGGRCTVYLTRVELSGVAAEGQTLDFLIKTFFMPLFPDAKIGQPFDLDYDIDRIDIRPSGVRVTIKR